MADFDINALLQRRAGTPTTDKIQEVMDASDRKMEALLKAANEHRSTVIQRKDALVSKFGMSTESVDGAAVNLGMNFFNGITKNIVGNIAQIPSAVAEFMNAKGLTQEHIEAITRYNNGQATEADMALIDPPVDPNSGYITPLERFNRAVQDHQVGQAIAEATDFSKRIDQTKKNQFSKQIETGVEEPYSRVAKEIWDNGTGPAEDASGIERLAYARESLKRFLPAAGDIAKVVGKATIDNPQGAAEYVVENAPQWLVGKFGTVGRTLMGASNAGYGADTYREAVESRIKKDGIYPSGDQHKEAAGASVAAAMMEQAGDVFTHGVSKKNKDLRFGLKEALKNTGKAGAAGFTEESITEGTQEALESIAKNEEIKAGKVISAGAIGGLTGSTLSGGSRLASEITGTTPEHFQQKKEDAVQIDAIKEAAKTGNVDHFLDKTKDTYSPESAVAALLYANQSEDTDLETKQANKAKADEILSTLEREKFSLENNLTRSSVAGLDKAIKEYTDLATTETDPDYKEALLNVVKDYEVKKASLVASGENKSAIKEAKKALEGINQQLLNVSKFRDEINAVSSIKPEDAKSLVELANTPVDPANPESSAASAKAIKQIINSSMTSEEFTPEHLEALAKNTSNGFTDAERATLRKISEAKLAQNAAKGITGVSGEVFNGKYHSALKERQLGINNYMEMISNALRSNNISEAERLYGMLNKFKNGHEAKLAQFDTAYKDALNKTTPTVSTNFFPEVGGVWRKGEVFNSVAESKNDQARVRSVGGQQINRNSGIMLNAVAQEAKALKATTEAMRSAIDLHKSQMSSANSQEAAASTANSSVNQSTVNSTVDSKETSTNTSSNKKKSYTNRDDLVGAILRVTGGKGILPIKSLDIIRDKVSEARNGVKSIFTSKGTEDLGDIATKLREEEGYDVRDGEHLAELINQHHEGTPVYSMERQDAEYAKHQEQQHKNYVRERNQYAKSLGLKMARGKRTFEQMEREIAFVEAQMKLWSEDQLSVVAALQEALNTNTPEEVLASLQDVLQQPIEALVDEVNRKLEEVAVEAKASRQAEDINNGNGTINAQEGTKGNEESSKGADSKSYRELNEGVLQVFNRFKEELTVQNISEYFFNTNLIAQFFKQIKNSEKFNTPRPLVALNNFLNQWNKDTGIVQYFLKEKDADEATEAQVRALMHLRETMNSWNEILQSQLTVYEGHPEFKWQDMMQYFLEDENGNADVKNIEQNVLSAMSFGMYSWTLNRSSYPTLLEQDEINKMFSRDKDAYISPEGLDVFSGVTGFEHTLANDLGGIAIQSLGLKALPNAPKDLMPRLRMAMGMHMLVALEKAEVLQRDYIRLQDVASFFGQEEIQDFDMSGALDVVRMNLDLNYQYEAQVQAIADANYGTSSIIDKVFGVDKAPVFASLKPEKFNQTNAKDTNQTISDEQKEAIQRSMDTPRVPIKDMFTIADAMGDAFLKVFGFVDTTKTFVHKNDLKGVEAQNRNLVSQNSLMREMIDSVTDGLNHVFYPREEVWMNFRAGTVTRSLNQQNSKIHRVMFTKPNWQFDLDLTNQDMIDEFKIVVAMNLGLVKTDQQINSKSLKEFEAKLSKNPKWEEAFNAIRDRLKDETAASWTDEAINNIVDLASGEGGVALQSMVAYAKYLQALDIQKTDPNQTKVRIEMIAGADGKTSGPILTHLALGAANTVEELATVMDRGGIHSVGEDQPKHFSDYFSREGAKDLYQALGASIMEKVVKRLVNLSPKEIWKAKREKTWDYSNFTAVQFAALETLTGDIKVSLGAVTKHLRNLVKTPITSFAFGSAVSKSINNMKDKFIDSFTTTIADIENGKRKDITREKFVEVINTLIDAGDWKVAKESPLIWDGSIEGFRTLSLSESQKNALRKAFDLIIGRSVSTAMESDFSTFIARRKNLNDTIQASFYAYQQVRDALYKEEVDRLVSLGELAYREVTSNGVTKREAVSSMNSEQERKFNDRIKDLLPIVNNTYSLKSLDINGGTFMAKTKNTTSLDPVYQSKINFSGAQQVREKTLTYINGKAIVYKESSPGVAGTPYLIHSFDSGTMHGSLNAIPEAQGTNVHDEVITSPEMIAKQAEAINKELADRMLDFSPAKEALATFERIAVELNMRVQSGEVSPQVAANIFKLWADTLNRNLPEDKPPISLVDAGTLMMNMSVLNAFNADTIRLGMLSQIAVVDQYTWEGGQYNVSQGYRDKAAEKLKTLSDAPSASLSKAIEELTKAVEGLTSKVEEKENIPSDTVVNSTWKKLGTSKAKRDLDMEQVFRDHNGKLTVKEVINYLAKTGKLKGFDAEHIRRVKALVNPNFVFNLVTPENVESVPNSHAPKENSKGWNITDPNTNISVAYVLSSEFQYAGLDAELLMHELTHMALDSAIANPTTTEAKELINELEAIRKEAEKYMKANRNIPVLFTIKSAVKNLHELVAYGMTSKVFREQVLSKIQYKSKNSGNALVRAAEGFINAIKKFFRIEQNNTALDALVSNVGGLFETVGQSNTGTIINSSMASPIAGYSTKDIYAALDEGKVSTSFAEKHLTLLTTTVNNIFSGFGTISSTLMQNMSLSELQVWAEAVRSGTAPFHSKIVRSGFPSNRQTTFVMEQVEASVRAGLESKNKAVFRIQRELEKLYREAHNKLTVSSFLPLASNNMNKAQELYDFMFKMEGTGNKMDYLSRFAALGLAHEGVNGLLKFKQQATAPITSGSFLERLENWYTRFIEWVGNKINHTNSDETIDVKLNTLVETLTGIEANYKAKMAAEASFDPMQIFDGVTQKIVEGAKTYANKAVNSNFIANNRFSTVRLAGGVVSTLTNNGVDALMETIQKFADSERDKGQSILSGLVTEARSSNDSNRIFHLLHREEKRRQAVRDHIKESTAKAIMQAFEDNGKNLTDDHKAAISAYLRIGVDSLLDKYSMTEISHLVNNDVYLEQEIASIEQALAKWGPQFESFYINQSIGLGFKMATGKAIIPSQLLNASNIAKALETPYIGRTTSNQINEAIPLIDMLSTMYGMKYMRDVHKYYGKEVFRQEQSRGTTNGMEVLLKYYKNKQAEAKDKLFGNTDPQFTKGYLPEIYNPYTKVITAPTADKADLIDQGYTHEFELPTDPYDPNLTGFSFYKLRGGGLAGYLSGASSMTGMAARGSRAGANAVEDKVTWLQNKMDISTMISAKQRQTRLFTPGYRVDPKQVKTTFAVPVFNDQGTATNQRYEMNEDLKDSSLMERNNDFAELVGTLVSQTYDKQTTEEQNKAVAQALFDQYQQDLSSRLDEYVYMDPDHPMTTPQMKEKFMLLPESMKQEIRKVWGKRPFMVRSDLVHITFGYRKYHLSDMFEKEQQFLNTFEKLFISGAKRVLGNSAAIKLRRFEDAWIEVIKEIKDFYVIKSGSTLLGNIISNFTELYWQGVPILDIAKHHVDAILGAITYRRDTAKLAELQFKLDTGVSAQEEKKLRWEIKKLDDAIQRNPVHTLMEAGLMPTIVDDVDSESSKYSYKERFLGYIDQKTNWVPSPFKKVAKFLYIGRDGKLYNALHYTTQLSDFVARYTLYQHVTNLKENPMSHEKAIEYASESYVNYDIPSHPMVQWANDVGLVYFTKYYVRIQKVLMTLMRESPARALSIMSFGNFFNSNSMVTNSTWPHHLNLPFSTGVFRAKSALESSLMAKGAMEFI